MLCFTKLHSQAIWVAILRCVIPKQGMRLLIFRLPQIEHIKAPTKSKKKKQFSSEFQIGERKLRLVMNTRTRAARYL